MTGRHHRRSCRDTAPESGAKTPNRFDPRRTDYANRPRPIVCASHSPGLQIVGQVLGQISAQELVAGSEPRSPHGPMRRHRPVGNVAPACWARCYSHSVRRSQAFTLPGETAAVAMAVQAFLACHKRITSVQWVEPQRHAVANVRSLATYGERLDIRIDQIRDREVRTEIVSESGPLWDWGANRRNIEALASHLTAAGFTISAEPMVTKAKIKPGQLRF